MTTCYVMCDVESFGTQIVTHALNVDFCTMLCMCYFIVGTTVHIYLSQNTDVDKTDMYIVYSI
jgi:hypothetical protein